MTLPGRKVRRYLFGGLAIIGPIGLSIWVLVGLFRWMDGLLGQYLGPVLGWSAPGVGILALLLLLLSVGWIAERALGARLVATWDRLLAKVPVASQVYLGSRRIFKTVLGENRLAFQEVVAFEWPREGCWVVGFVTGRAPLAIEPKLAGGSGVTVYLPTAPNPASGYLLVLPRSGLTVLDVGVEEAFTYVLSAGSVAIGEAAERLAGVEPASGWGAVGQREGQ